MFLDKRSSGPLAQLVEQLTFNQWVTGSNPVRLTTEINDLAGFLLSLVSVDINFPDYTRTNNCKLMLCFMLGSLRCDYESLHLEF